MRVLWFVGVSTSCCVIAACGKSTRDVPAAEGARGGSSSAASGTGNGGAGTDTAGASGGDAAGTAGRSGAPAGGSGGELTLGGAAGAGATGGTTGAGATGGTTGAGAAGGTVGAGAAGGTIGGSADPAEAGAAGSAGEPALCGDHEGFVTITGELPLFGEDVTLSSSCPGSAVAPYPKPASYKGGSGEGAGGLVRISACSSDGNLEFEARFSYGFNRPDAGSPGLESATLRYAADRVWSSLPITSLTETKMPVDDWLAVTLGSEVGVGSVYEGSFDAEGTIMGTAASVKVTFSVCHVANLLQ